MDFLFTVLPESNFQMDSKQLMLWQHNAMFECECDNFINSRIEISRQVSPQYLGNYAIDAAIQHHGLQPRHGEMQYNDNITQGIDPFQHFPYRRRHVVSDGSHGLQYGIYQDAISEAIRDRGLGLLRNVPF